MRIDSYQERAFSTALYERKGEGNLEYVGLGLGGETGEVQELFKRLFRGEGLDSGKLKFELGDVLWYIAGTVTESGKRLSQILGAETFSEFQIGLKSSWLQTVSTPRLSLLLGSYVGKVQDGIYLTTHPERPVDQKEYMFVHLRNTLECLTILAIRSELTLNQIAAGNLDKLKDRKARGVLRGSGSER